MDALLRETYGDFLNQFPWDWYCRLTFRNRVSSRIAFKLFNKWKVRLKKAANHRIDYALVIEPTCSRNGIPHLHLLLIGAENEKPYIWEQRWHLIGGLAKIKTYDPKLGASHYLGGKMARGTVEVIFSKRLAEVARHNSLAVPKKIPISIT